MSEFAIFLTIDVIPGKKDAFLEQVRINRARSLADEPGCKRYDILDPDPEGHRLNMYEVYASAAAFEAHRRTPHFATCSAAIQPLVAARKLEQFTLLP
jgi:quinol monooxygenase YgiN